MVGVDVESRVEEVLLRRCFAELPCRSDDAHIIKDIHTYKCLSPTRRASVVACSLDLHLSSLP